MSYYLQTLHTKQYKHGLYNSFQIETSIWYQELVDFVSNDILSIEVLWQTNEYLQIPFPELLHSCLIAKNFLTNKTAWTFQG